MIIDGRTLAKEILARAKARAEHLPHSPKVLVIVVNETLATKSYLAIKQKKAAEAGCILSVRNVPYSKRSSEIVDMLKTTIRESDADAIIVQLPVLAGVNQKEACDAIPVEKDADVLSSAARTRFESSGRSDLPELLPPVVGTVREIFMRYNVELKEKKAVVIGDGWLVGNPCARWLTQQGAKVSVLTSESGNLSATLNNADIVISGAGFPHLIKPDMLKEGVVLVDAGTSESSGVIVGDAEPACAVKCSLFTPVPGGVGPVAVAKLFENVVTLAERADSFILFP